MEQSQDMILVGYHSFNSKDKTQKFYVVQCLYSEKNVSNGDLRGTMINIFVDFETYNKIKVGYDIGSSLKVEVSANLSTNKIYYKIVF